MTVSNKVRAKFKMDSYGSTLYQRMKDTSKGWTADNVENVEMRTIKLSPVYANNDPNHENSRFWRSSPSGTIELGTINPEAWAAFELGKEYYIDFQVAS